jgi:hypothetical protein
MEDGPLAEVRREKGEVREERCLEMLSRSDDRAQPGVIRQPPEKPWKQCHTGISPEGA